MSLSPAFLDELRARTSLSALIGKSVKLTKAGREWKACCPFHNEKSPSFYVNDDKGFYHCFGCSAHGDAIRWMTDQRGLPFIDAVKELALAAGMDMPAMDPRGAEKAERQAGLHDVTTRAAAWFAEQLHGLDGAAARTLLERRGVKAETARAFGMGFAPDSRTRLRTALKDIGDEKLVETGLLIQVDDPGSRSGAGKEPYDRFRGRLMIPIRDVRGRTIAFGGRIIGDGEPKYLNSPDTPLFDKGRTLFNLDRAAGPARKAGRIIVVEGYMDVIALAQAGIEEAVAPLGTALTEAQLERLWRIADVPLICLDGDSAGQKAALRAAHRALPMLAHDRSLAFVTLPPGQDPDDFVRTEGREKFEALLAVPEPLVETLWNAEVSGEPLVTPEARTGLGKRLRAHARLIRDDELREEYLATFNRMVWDLFHPDRPSETFTKANKRAPLSGADRRLRVIADHGIDQAAIIPALIKGLILHPTMIAPLAESLTQVPIHHTRLRQTRETMLDAALGNPALDSEGLLAILRGEALHPVIEQMDKVTIAFSFLLPGSEAALIMDDLAKVTELLVASSQVNDALAMATSRMETEMDDATFVEQQRLRTARFELDERLANLMQADKDGL